MTLLFNRSMPAPLSLDLRERILGALLSADATQKEIALRFCVGKATVGRLARLYRETESVAPKPHAGGRIPLLSLSDYNQVVDWYDKEPDLTQQQIASRYESMGRPMSQQTVSRSLRRLNITRKKRPFAPRSS
jgi:transposase